MNAQWNGENYLKKSNIKLFNLKLYYIYSTLKLFLFANRYILSEYFLYWKKISFNFIKEFHSVKHKHVFSESCTFNVKFNSEMTRMPHFRRADTLTINLIFNHTWKRNSTRATRRLYLSLVIRERAFTSVHSVAYAARASTSDALFRLRDVRTSDICDVLPTRCYGWRMQRLTAELLLQASPTRLLSSETRVNVRVSIINRSS
jgi:hypothetical protein